MSSRSSLVLGGCLTVVVLSACPSAWGQYQLSLTDAEGPPGSFRWVTASLDSSLGIGIDAWSFGVCHDLTVVDPVEAELGSTVEIVNDGLPADFAVINLLGNDDSVPAGMTVGVNSGVVVDFTGDQELQPGPDHEFLRILYRLEGSSGDVGEIAFCGTTPGGLPPVAIVLAIDGVSIVPDLRPASIVIDQPFRRGDTNGDGVFNVADPVFALFALFVPGSPEPDCVDAADSNDDNTFDVADATFALAALFIPGSPDPLPPGPTTCGVDPSPDTLPCQPTACQP